MLIETDVLLAALNQHYPLCEVARVVLALEHLMLSPYSMLEWNLLVRAGKIRVKSFSKTSERLEGLFRTREIKIIADRPSFHSLAHEIESKYGLTFFDSLHAAAAKLEDQELLSFDTAYRKLRGLGVRHTDPRVLLKQKQSKGIKSKSSRP